MSGTVKDKLPVLQFVQELLDSGDSESTDDEDRKALLKAAKVATTRNKRHRIKFYCENVVPSYSRVEYVRHFRLTPDQVTFLAVRFGASLFASHPPVQGEQHFVEEDNGKRGNHKKYIPVLTISCDASIHCFSCAVPWCQVDGCS